MSIRITSYFDGRIPLLRQNVRECISHVDQNGPTIGDADDAIAVLTSIERRLEEFEDVMRSYEESRMANIKALSLPEDVEIHKLPDLYGDIEDLISRSVSYICMSGGKVYPIFYIYTEEYKRKKNRKYHIPSEEVDKYVKWCNTLGSDATLGDLVDKVGEEIHSGDMESDYAWELISDILYTLNGDGETTVCV